MMSMRLERNVRGPAACAVARPFERNCLSMFELIVKIETFAGDLALRIDDDCANERSRAYLADALRGEGKRTLHHLAIEVLSLECRVWSHR